MHNWERGQATCILDDPCWQGHRGDFNAEWNLFSARRNSDANTSTGTDGCTPCSAPAQKPAPTATAMQTANSALTSLQALLDPRRREESTDE
jgi:hypothetical protein